MSANRPDPSRILQTGLGFMASKTLLSAIELRLFTHLASGPITAAELGEALGLHPRARFDLLDALVSLGFLNRDGDGPEALYSNTPETAAFLNERSPDYIAGFLQMASARLYHHWADLTEALRTGKPQNESKSSGRAGFDALYADPARLELFVAAMAAFQKGNFRALAERFDFSKYDSCCDVGGASGALCIEIAQRHRQIRCTTLDLPQVAPIARKRVAEAGLADRILVAAGDFLKDPLPQAGVLTMGNILHDWGLEIKEMLIGKAYEALPAGGAFVAIENIIDNERRANTLGLLMSLNMLIETENGFDYTGAQFDAWCRQAGFKSTEFLPLAGATAAVAFK
ncbi:MAG: methyltransferase [Acidobacteria bacterium]|nr:methyltransferase [Acidobacteriota bacterium]